LRKPPLRSCSVVRARADHAVVVVAEDVLDGLLEDLFFECVATVLQRETADVCQSALKTGQ
jgi:hypothetical protein